MYDFVPSIKCTELYADSLDDYRSLVGEWADELICPQIQGDYLNQTDADELLIMDVYGCSQAKAKGFPTPYTDAEC